MRTLATSLLASLALGASWDYKQGGADWGSIAGNELCDTGKEQSPINIKTKKAEYSDTIGISLADYLDFTNAVV